MTNNPEYQRGYREGAEKMRERAMDYRKGVVSSKVNVRFRGASQQPLEEDVEFNANVGMQLLAIDGLMRELNLPITPPQPEARDDQRMREAFIEALRVDIDRFMRAHKEKQGTACFAKLAAVSASISAWKEKNQ